MKKKRKTTIAPKKSNGKKKDLTSTAKSGNYTFNMYIFFVVIGTFVPESKEKESGAVHKNVIKEQHTHNDGSNSSSDEDYSDDEDEGEDGYRPGGYHPVRIGDKFHNSRYVVIEKLGWGHFSTVWLCYDKKKSFAADHPEYVALKIQKSAIHYREAAIDEIELLNSISSAALSAKIMDEYPSGTTVSDLCLVNLVDNFDHVGPNGRHVSMAFEVLGENLLKVIKKYDYRGMSVGVVKGFVRQMCVGLDFLHRHCNIIHTDLKPENILIAHSARHPDMSVVRALIADKPSTKKKSKKSGATASSTAHAPVIESITVHDSARADPALLSAGGEKQAPLTAEERKKLKKRLKKKKAQAAKKGERRGNGDKKAARSSRRDDPPCTRDSVVTGLSKAVPILGDEQQEEMLLMEMHSEPVSAAPVDLDLGSLSLASSETKKVPLVSSAADHKAVGITYNYPSSSKMSAYEDDEETPGGGSDRDWPGASSAASASGRIVHSSDHKHVGDADHEGVEEQQEEDFEYEAIVRRMPPFMRPSLFAYLNLDMMGTACGDSSASLSSVCADPKISRSASLAYDGFASIDPGAYIRPSRVMYAKISMVSLRGLRKSLLCYLCHFHSDPAHRQDPRGVRLPGAAEHARCKGQRLVAVRRGSGLLRLVPVTHAQYHV